METTNTNSYNGTNKRTINALKASEQGAKFNIIPSKNKTYPQTTIGMLFFACGNTTGYVTKKVAMRLNEITDKAEQVAFVNGCLIADHIVKDQDGNPTTLPCLEVDSPTALLSI